MTTPSEALAKVKEAITLAFKELNAIRARDGAPQHIDWYNGRPTQTDGCAHEWFEEVTDKTEKSIALLSIIEAAIKDKQDVRERAPEDAANFLDKYTFDRGATGSGVYDETLINNIMENTLSSIAENIRALKGRK